jgi:hypothetical protein
LEKAWDVKDRWEQMGKESFALFKQKFPENINQFFLDQIQGKVNVL